MKSRLLISILLLSSFLLRAQVPDWSVNTGSYQYTMTFTAFLNVDGSTLSHANDKVGAFVNGEKRGEISVAYNSNFDKYVAYLTVYANTAGETINFKIYDSVNDRVVDALQTYTFSIDKNVGRAFQSFALSNQKLQDEANFTAFNFKGVTAISSAISQNKIDVVLPVGTSINSLTPIFSTSSKAKVYKNYVKQVSGNNAHDFTNAIVYGVLSEDESVLNTYEVTVHVANSTNPTTVAISTYNNVVKENLIPISIAFSESISGLDESDFILQNGILTNLRKTSNKLFTANLVAFSEGQIAVQLPGGAVKDIHSDDNMVSNELIINFDATHPIIVDVANAGLDFTIRFSEDVKNVTIDDFELMGIAKDAYTLTSIQKLNDKSYVLTIKEGTSKKGNVYIAAKSNTDITDIHENPLRYQSIETYYVEHNANSIDYSRDLIEIYPNPTKSYTHIKMGNNDQIRQIRIYDMIGSVLLSKNINSSATVVDLQHFDQGTYILEVITDNDRLHKKIIKQ